MLIDILTAFPEMFTGPFDYSILRRAQDKLLLKINIHNLRDWADDKYKSIDDKPYGGGPGMILRIDLLDRAIQELKNQSAKCKVVLLDAGGEKFNQKKAHEFAKYDHLIIICGHYEGVDHRVHEHLADEVISIGDYVLSGGEIPAMVIVDTVTRLLPGALGNADSLKEESHSTNYEQRTTSYSEYPQYTRPEVYKDWKVPEVLLSGDHKKIAEWKHGKRS